MIGAGPGPRALGLTERAQDACAKILRERAHPRGGGSLHSGGGKSGPVPQMIRTRWASDVARILSMIFARRFSIVRRPSPKVAPISRLDLPSISIRATACSPLDKRAQRVSRSLRAGRRFDPLQIAHQRLFNARDKILALHRLLHEVQCAALHRFDRRRHVGITGDDDYRQIDAALGQCGLYVESLHALHAQIQQ